MMRIASPSAPAIISTRSPRGIVYPGTIWTPAQLPSLAISLRANAGVQTDAAASFASASSQYLSVASNAGLQTGGGSFCIAVWVKTAASGLNQGVVAKWLLPNQEYLLQRDGAGNIKFWLSQDGTTANNVLVVPITVNAWNLVIAWYDSVAQTANVQVNGGAVNSVSYTVDVNSGTTPLQLGNNPNGPQYLDGLIDSTGFWKRILTSAERTWLYNAGAGHVYGDIAAGQPSLTTNLQAWWDFESASKLLVDSSGNGNTLTNNNAVTLGTGIAAGAANDGDPSSSWGGQDGTIITPNQPALNNMPAYSANVGGVPALTFNGTNNFLNVPNSPAATSFSISMWIYPTALGGYRVLYGAGNRALYLNDNNVNWYQDGDHNSAVVIPLNQLSQVGMTTDGTTLKIWINGVAVASYTFSASMLANDAVKIGGNGSSQFFSGSIMDVLMGTADWSSNMAAIYAAGPH